MHLHKWGNWELGTADWIRRNGAMFRETVQFRKCSKCGLIKMRELSEIRN